MKRKDNRRCCANCKKYLTCKNIGIFYDKKTNILTCPDFIQDKKLKRSDKKNDYEIPNYIR